MPDTHQHPQPQVVPYEQMFGGASMDLDVLGIFALIQVFALMLLVLVFGNVALLLFARAATREGEIIVRSALGASRRRIVVQLFAEALVLGVADAGRLGLRGVHAGGVPARLRRPHAARAPGGADRSDAGGVGDEAPVRRPP